MSLDHKIPVSFFDGLKLTRPTVRHLSMAELALHIPTKTARTKNGLPMLKLAVMEGGAKAEDVKSWTGAMVDYDAGVTSIEDAAEMLSDAGVAAIVYTSPSSSAESPRWRALAPYSRPMNPVEHQAMTDRLNSVLGGVIDDAASWVTSLRFYYGQALKRDEKKGGGDADPVEVYESDGEFIDQIEGIEILPRPERVKAVRAADPFDLSDILADEDDELYDLLKQSPLGMTLAEAKAIMDSLPNTGEGAHYDDYVKYGMALHHEFDGADAAFDIWCDWAAQSSKFDRRNAVTRWRSFGKRAGGESVRMASLIKEASNQKLAAEHDLVIDTPPSIALKEYDLDLSDVNLDLDIFGDPVVPETKRHDTQSQIDPEWRQNLHRNEEGEIKTSLHNVTLIVANDIRTHSIPQYNVFKQDKAIRRSPPHASKKREKAKSVVNLEGPIWKVSDPVNGVGMTDTHYTDIRRVIEAPTGQGGYGIKVSDRDLYGAVDVIARANPFHPIQEALQSVQWDRQPRAETLFIDYLGCADTPYYRQAALLFLLGAVARVFQPGHKFDFVPILEGAQGQGKSTFIRILGLDWFRELSGDISKPQEAVSMLAGAWILEIGELSAMHRAEVNDLKAFVSRQVDTARMPYERTSRDFPRQCIFIGSTNDSEYLRDPTGGRRFWPIKCEIQGMIDNPRLRRNIMQIWAEVLHRYLDMQSSTTAKELNLSFTDKEAAAEAALLQESRRVETSEEGLAGQIEAWLNAPIGIESGFDDLDPDAPKEYRQETCLSQIWCEMMGRDGAVPHTETIKIGKAMQIVGWARTAGAVAGFEINKKYGKCRVYTRSHRRTVI